MFLGLESMPKRYPAARSADRVRVAADHRRGNGPGRMTAGQRPGLLRRPPASLGSAPSAPPLLRAVLAAAQKSSLLPSWSCRGAKTPLGAPKSGRGSPVALRWTPK